MPEGFRFACPIRVRYSEIDRQGIVYYSRYLEYVDVALSEYFRALGFPYQELVEQRGFDPSVVKAIIEFKRTAHFDEALQVWARVAAIGRTSLTMDFAITRAANDELVTSIQIVYVNFDTAAQASRLVPESVRRRIEAFEGTSFSPSS